VLGDECRPQSVDQRGEAAQVIGVGLRRGGERKRDAVQRHRMPGADRLEPGEPRPACDQVVLGLDLEPESVRRRGERLLEVLGLEPQPGGRWHGAVQLLTGVSDPMPVGVFMVVQVPFATYFQALPW